MKKIIILTVLLVLCSVGVVFSAILFDVNGKWETTLNCNEQSGSDFSPEQNTGCNDVLWKTPVNNVSGNYSQITTAANNPSGGGGRGFRFWVGEGTNKQSGSLGLYFPSAQKELWIRWTMRYQQGFSWVGGAPHYDKHLYIYTAGGNSGTQVIPVFVGDKYVASAQSTRDYYQVRSYGGDGGWADIMGGARGDGQWHTYEVYIKMDTNQTNGAGRVWVDGVLVAENTSVDFSDGRTLARPGWVNLNFLSNQNNVAGGPYYIDFDDMIIYNKTPPNRDAQGNPFIGLIRQAGGAEGISAPKEFYPEN